VYRDRFCEFLKLSADVFRCWSAFVFWKATKREIGRFWISSVSNCLPILHSQIHVALYTYRAFSASCACWTARPKSWTVISILCLSKTTESECHHTSTNWVGTSSTMWDWTDLLIGSWMVLATVNLWYFGRWKGEAILQNNFFRWGTQGLGILEFNLQRREITWVRRALLISPLVTFHTAIT
jgi:hypothetical protein